MLNTEKGDIKRFFKKFAILVVALVVLDFAIGSTFKHFYFKQTNGLLYRTTYAIDSTRADLLVFGSSRANHHYVPEIFEKKLNTTFYNCGRDGSDMIYSIAVLSAVLERYTPKHVILELNVNELARNEEGNLSSLLPYHDNPAINHYLSYNSKFEKVKMLSKMYQYNSTLTTIIVGNMSLGRAGFEDDKGFVGIDKVMPRHPKASYYQGVINNMRVNILNDILKKLNERHIAVSVVISPVYFTVIQPDAESLTIKDVCQKYPNVHFYNYENDPAYDNANLFSDDVHMNRTGANKFSEDLTNRILAAK